MDSLLAGKLPPFQGRLACHCDVQRCYDLWKSFRDQRERHSGIGRKPFTFPPESLFAFSPESCSSSFRNAVRVHPGIPFALPRNPQIGTQEMLITWRHKAEGGGNFN
jgi:hypothetical protein